MFGFLALLLCYSLLTFGAVQPTNWFVLSVLWVGGACLIFIIQIVRYRSVDASFFVLSIASTFVFWAMLPKQAIGFIAVAWAWTAARNADNRRIGRFLHFLLVIGLLEALLGLVQYFLSPGWILGYVNPYSVSSGTLINRNHFAGLLEMIVPVSVGLAYTAARRHAEFSRPYLYLLAGGFIGLALVFSLSRAGILCFLATLFFLGITVQLRKSQGKTAVVLGLAIVAMVLVGALWIGIDGIIQRYSELAGEEALFREGRLVVFKDAARMIREHPFGVGSGNFQDQFRMYQTFRPELIFDHAHNDYLETAAEWGFLLASVFWSLLVFVVIRGVRLFGVIESPEKRGILLACSGAIFSILLHSLTDFNLQIPSNAILFFAIVGISFSVSDRRSLKERESVPITAEKQF
jgi:O-antigen ligase